MFVLLALHLIVGIAIVATGDRFGRRAFLVAAVAPLATVVWAAARAADVLDGRPVDVTVTWVEALGLGLDLRLDALALAMTALVSGIGLLVCVYAVGYFAHPAPGDSRLAGLMTLFAGAMLGVVWSDHLIALFVAWELTSVTSYLLIGNDDRNPRARAAALQAILITGAGGLVMLVGLIIVGQAANTYRISELLADPPSGGVIGAGLVCILVGAFTKSAQAPFGSWLPGAMVAPTPISAYLHSATMVKAGVYLVARLSPIFATVGSWRLLVLVVGATTMLIGGLRALRQTDLKLLLAHGTVSQLGFLMLLFGTGEYTIAQAGVALLLAHGAFKAALFMVVGIVDHEVGTREVGELHGFEHGWRPTLAVGVIGAASMAGLPPLFGFIAKEKALDGYVEHGAFTGSGVVLAVIVIGSILTFAYSARFVLGLLGRLGTDDAERRSPTAHPPAAVFIGPAVVLTAFSVVAGLAPVIVDRLVRASTLALQPGVSPSTVKLWAGFNTALVLSLVVIGTGVVLTIFGRRVAELQRRASHAIRWMPSAEQGFLFCLRSTVNGSKRITAVVQSGSLPVYLAVILTVATLAPLIPAVSVFPSLPTMVDTPIQIPLAIVVVVAAVAASAIRRRIAAALLLGAVGYGMAGLFIVQGAPDLALTQLVIETLATVLFVLVLRFLPARWADRSIAIARPIRLTVSAMVGVTVFVLALVSAGARDAVEQANISEGMIERSAPEAKGNNVVNVILVDFRGLDTLGEITVLVVAAVGAVALARTGRRRDDGTSTGSDSDTGRGTGDAGPDAVEGAEVRVPLDISDDGEDRS
ncbi:MAG: hydrogen gas-evolving membrane-bound hydrogenase subunit E [Ilumatobacteraceae bacterium]